MSRAEQLSDQGVSVILWWGLPLNQKSTFFFFAIAGSEPRLLGSSKRSQVVDKSLFDRLPSCLLWVSWGFTICWRMLRSQIYMPVPVTLKSLESERVFSGLWGAVQCQKGDLTLCSLFVKWDLQTVLLLHAVPKRVMCNRMEGPSCILYKVKSHIAYQVLLWPAI